MRHPSLLWSLLLSSSLLAADTALAQRPPAKRNHDTYDYYVVEHAPLAGAALDEVSKTLGIEIVERVGELDDVWLARAPKAMAIEERGDEVDRVFAVYQGLRNSVKGRGLLHRSPTDDNDIKLLSSIKHLSKQTLHQLEKRAPPPIRPPPTVAQVIDKYDIQDPFFPMQWHISNDRYPEHMMNVTPVWDMGYKGKGVITSILDDGLDYTNEDLKENFDAANSYDFNDHEKLPFPKNFKDHHGTRCGGQIAALKNGMCGVGLAYESKVAGLRILAGKITTADEAAALNYGYQNVSIYSCSWGPKDDGMHMQAPHYLARRAVLNGINKGRGGKGSVFVFASGNGAHKGDQCNFDGYTNSIYSVTVGSVDFKGLHPKYSEPCAANMVVGYSSGSGEHIVTTDRGKEGCSLNHGGTSAAAPNVAAVFALALGARPDLTWRDIQHLCVQTARRVNPQDRDWQHTATGRYYSYKFGYGAIDASLYVQRALDWKVINPQTWIKTETVQLDGGKMDEDFSFEGGRVIGKEGVKSQITITDSTVEKANLDMSFRRNGEAEGTTGLEHITIKVWIEHTRRGDVEVVLISPNGIRSVLAGKRERDDDSHGFRAWTFMTVKHWGEDPRGAWTLHVSDQNSPIESGKFLGWNMVLWGAAKDAFKTRLYEMETELESIVLPPIHIPFRPGTPGEMEGTKTQALEGKPTADLPEGATNPDHTLDDAKDGTSGWMKGLDGSSRKAWLVGIVSFLILANVFAAVYYCCIKPRCCGGEEGKYNALPGDENVPMANINGGRDGSGRRYDEEEGELAAPGGGRDGLVARSDLTSQLGVDDLGRVVQAGSQVQQPPSQGQVGQTSRSAGLGFHSSFLDDDPLSAATSRFGDDLDSAGLASAVGKLIDTADDPPPGYAPAEPTQALQLAQAPVTTREVSEEESDDDDDDDDDDEESDEDSEEESDDEDSSEEERSVTREQTTLGNETSLI